MSAAATAQSGQGGLPIRRRWLWLLLVGLVLALLGMLVWLAARYEASQVQDKLEHDAQVAASDIRSGLARSLQSLQALQFNDPTPASWQVNAMKLLGDGQGGGRVLVRLEWRDATLMLAASKAQADSPFHPPVFAMLGRGNSQAQVEQVCTTARTLNAPTFSNSYFVPLAGGIGLEVMEACLPLLTLGRETGYLVATYSLQDILGELLGRELVSGQEVSFTEGDGTRLAVRRSGQRASRVFTTQQLVDLPGNTLVLKLNSSRGAPDLFPNVLTALVAVMSMALLAVLALLGKDMRRRLKAEHDLADALAFRKAMEDSLVTGLRARDLSGRTTYVNPAFCEMVGFSAQELEQVEPAPYWPQSLVNEYAKRKAIRLAGNVPPREGFESVFMRKDGTLFPVLIIEAPLINAQGVQSGWMSAFLDISEQRRVQELSRASQERLQATARLAMVGEMASLLSHELNQPLAAISSYAAGSVNLLDDIQADAAQAVTLTSTQSADLQAVLQRIAQQAERAGKVIKSVHDFVRRRDQAREAVAPLALVEAVLPLVSLQARKLQVQVHVDVADELPQVLCDRTMIEQVLLNLARNGMQAMDQPEIVDRQLLLNVERMVPALSETDQSKEWLAFSVVDLGLGLTDEVKQQLFTPFFTTKADGMGLGLSLCRTVVEQHGGALTFEPNAPHGTVFKFALPAAA
jgi:two-component system, LuxR family, sensor histidine kinase DctS